MTNVEALKTLYIALGGKTTDTYNHICNGEPIDNYVITSDIICAIAQLGSIQIVGGAFSTDEDNNVIITTPNNIYLEADSGEIHIDASNTVAIQTGNNFNINADEEINIESGDTTHITSQNYIDINAINDINIISENSEIEIDAQGADLTLHGDAVTANGKEVATVS